MELAIKIKLAKAKNRRTFNTHFIWHNLRQQK